MLYRAMFVSIGNLNGISRIFAFHRDRIPHSQRVTNLCDVTPWTDTIGSSRVGHARVIIYGLSALDDAFPATTVKQSV